MFDIITIANIFLIFFLFKQNQVSTTIKSTRKTMPKKILTKNEDHSNLGDYRIYDCLHAMRGHPLNL